MKKWVLCILAGAITAQIWGTISWMILPWHNMDHRQFKDDQRVAAVISEEAVDDGLYVIPNMDPYQHEDPEKMTEWNNRAEAGPFAFMSIRTKGIQPGMALPMGIGVIMNFLITGVLFWLASQTTLQSTGKKVLFYAVAGGIGSVFPHISNFTWWHFPFMYCFAGTADLFLTWGLAGFAMIKVQAKV